MVEKHQLTHFTALNVTYAAIWRQLKQVKPLAVFVPNRPPLAPSWVVVLIITGHFEESKSDMATSRLISSVFVSRANKDIVKQKSFSDFVPLFLGT